MHSVISEIKSHVRARTAHVRMDGCRRAPHTHARTRVHRTRTNIANLAKTIKTEDNDMLISPQVMISMTVNA